MSVIAAIFTGEKLFIGADTQETTTDGNGGWISRTDINKWLLMEAGVVEAPQKEDEEEGELLVFEPMAFGVVGPSRLLMIGHSYMTLERNRGFSNWEHFSPECFASAMKGLTQHEGWCSDDGPPSSPLSAILCGRDFCWVIYNEFSWEEKQAHQLTTLGSGSSWATGADLGFINGISMDAKDFPAERISNAVKASVRFDTGCSGQWYKEI